MHDTLNPIRITMVDPEGRTLLSGYTWRLPAVGDTMSIPVEDPTDEGAYQLIEAEVTHRHWHPAVSSIDEPSCTLTVETGNDR